MVQALISSLRTLIYPMRMIFSKIWGNNNAYISEQLIKYTWQLSMFSLYSL